MSLGTLLQQVAVGWEKVRTLVATSKMEKWFPRGACPSGGMPFGWIRSQQAEPETRPRDPATDVSDCRGRCSAEAVAH